jgi:hypothetical protein
MDLYCFPSYQYRSEFTAFGGYTVQVKRDAFAACGPGNNWFSDDTVSYDSAKDELKLQFRKIGGKWVGSEVRILLDQMPYVYGKYEFSVKSIQIKNIVSGVTKLNLDKDLVLGLFTWDPTEDYATHENWNHEVDIEISQWGQAGNKDLQFLVQPPEAPHYYRFWSGAGNTLDQAPHVYQFTWLPTSMEWYTDAQSTTYTYTTSQALGAGLEDRIQCLPANVEVRINLWNMNGNSRPSSMTDTDVVEVVIDDFNFVPAAVQGAAAAQACSKDCQCLSGTCNSSNKKCA